MPRELRLGGNVTRVSYRACALPYEEQCCLRQPHHRRWNQTISSSQAELDRAYYTLDLDRTFDYMSRGGSLARFGDGELRLLLGHTGGWEDANSDGGREARKGLQFTARLGGSPYVWPLICIGTVPLLDGKMERFREGARRELWTRARPGYLSSWIHSMAPGSYCNSMVSRPDALDLNVWPAIEYYTPAWRRVFADKRVLLVGGIADDGGPTTQDPTVFVRHLSLATHVERMQFFRNSSGGQSLIQAGGMFQHYVPLRNSIVDEVERLDIDTVVISLGPTATVLAAELGCRGYHILDVGQFGGNFSKPASKKHRSNAKREGGRR